MFVRMLRSEQTTTPTRPFPNHCWVNSRNQQKKDGLKKFEDLRFLAAVLACASLRRRTAEHEIGKVK